MAYVPALSRFPKFEDVQPCDPYFKCIFPPKTKPNTRCNGLVRRDNQYDAKALRATILSSFEAGKSIHSDLKEYAQLLCCGRWHEKWMRALPHLLDTLAQRWTIELKATRTVSPVVPQLAAPAAAPAVIEPSPSKLRIIARTSRDATTRTWLEESEEVYTDTGEDDSEADIHDSEYEDGTDSRSSSSTSSAYSSDDDSAGGSDRPARSRRRSRTPKTELASTMIIKTEHDGESKLIINLKALDALSEHDVGRKLLQTLLPVVRRETTDVNQNTCKICYETDANSAFNDCGHSCSCYECAKDLDKCPICRKRVKSVLKIYKA